MSSRTHACFPTSLLLPVSFQPEAAGAAQRRPGSGCGAPRPGSRPLRRPVCPARPRGQPAGSRRGGDQHLAAALALERSNGFSCRAEGPR
ncbi:hypothetical protein VULLAG_LOCUS9362 [Vulpes lagopus]